MTGRQSTPGPGQQRKAEKGVKTVTQEYRPSQRVEDQEAGSVGGPWAASLSVTWPVRPAAPAGSGDRTQPKSYVKTATL